MAISKKFLDLFLYTDSWHCTDLRDSVDSIYFVGLGCPKYALAETARLDIETLTITFFDSDDEEVGTELLTIYEEED